MGVLQRWGGGLSRRKRAALAAEAAAAAQREQEAAARRAAEEAAAQEAARRAAETAQRQAEEAAQRQRDEYARQQAEILARQQTMSAAPPASEILNQQPAPTPAPQPYTPTPIPTPNRPAPFSFLPTVNIFSPGIRGPVLPGSSSMAGNAPPAEIMGVPIPQPASFNIYSPQSGGRPTGTVPAVNFFSSMIGNPSPITNVDPFAPAMGNLSTSPNQPTAFQPVALQYQTIPNIFALRPLGGL